ncbi:uncharacterized protein LOC144582689 [Callithrix jacchus]
MAALSWADRVCADAEGVTSLREDFKSHQIPREAVSQVRYPGTGRLCVGRGGGTGGLLTSERERKESEEGLTSGLSQRQKRQQAESKVGKRTLASSFDSVPREVPPQPLWAHPLVPGPAPSPSSGLRRSRLSKRHLRPRTLLRQGLASPGAEEHSPVITHAKTKPRNSCYLYHVKVRRCYRKKAHLHAKPQQNPFNETDLET